MPQVLWLWVSASLHLFLVIMTLRFEVVVAYVAWQNVCSFFFLYSWGEKYKERTIVMSSTPVPIFSPAFGFVYWTMNRTQNFCFFWCFLVLFFNLICVVAFFYLLKHFPSLLFWHMLTSLPQGRLFKLRDYGKDKVYFKLIDTFFIYLENITFQWDTLNTI